MKYLAKNPKKIVMKMFRIGMTVKHVLISFQNIKGIQRNKKNQRRHYLHS